MSWEEDFEDGPLEVPKPRNRGGRPRGVKNKTPEQKMLEGKLTDLYKRVEHMLDEDMKKYLKDVIAGKVQIDPVKEAELLLRYLSVYASASITWALDQQMISQDLAKIVGEYRMGIKDLEDMKRKREELKMKQGEDERLVDPTRKPALARIESILGEDSSRRAG